MLLLVFPIKASESWTNWTWVNLGLSIPQTNLVIGGKILASIVVSNTVNEEHVVFYDSVQPCNCGFGWFSIVEVSSGKKVKYFFTPTGFGSVEKHLAGHKLESFDFDLTRCYAITNAGLYSVSVTGWFPISESLTNQQYATVVTPPIIISLSPKIELDKPTMAPVGPKKN